MVSLYIYVNLMRTGRIGYSGASIGQINKVQLYIINSQDQPYINIAQMINLTTLWRMPILDVCCKRAITAKPDTRE